MGQEQKDHTWNLIAKKLTGEATPEELRELEALLRNNPELHYPLQAITDLWKSGYPDDRQEAGLAFLRHLDRMHALRTAADEAGDLLPVRENEPVYPGGEPDVQFIPARRSRYRGLKLAGVSLGILGVLAGVWLFTRPANPAAGMVSNSPAPEAVTTVFTRYGSRTNLLLPDGTQVWLNAGSKITYDKNYGSSSREIDLTGEAYFDVVKNAGKPFIIHTSKIDITVLGTSFNVKSYPADRTTEATLIRGSIEVSIKDRPSERIILKPNEKLVVANEDSTLYQGVAKNHRPVNEEPIVSIRKPTYEQNTGAIIETSWVEDKLSFQDENFRDLAQQLERWYGVSIRFDQPGLEDLHFTGTFRKETVQQALNALKLTSQFTWLMHDSTITIFAK